MTKTILAVDDSESIRETVSFTLRQAGYQVLLAEDGQEALSVAGGAGPIGMVITDLNMPNLDGIGLIKALREKPAFAGVPIIMLTTESNPEAKQQGKAAGATGWIVKPFKPDQLSTLVQKLCPA